ncbi:MAG: GNAT family N-acetyltransferase [Deltaproteobacteria bacterium]|nr:GNAT family N-acetyltransferase [Deltaproteobacteria bacterium]
MLTTERLELRPIARADHARLLAIFRDPYVRRYLWDSVICTPAEVEDVLAQSEAAFRDHGVGIFGVAVCGASELIGFAGARPTKNGELELIYGLLPEHWGRGFTDEASRAVLALAFERGHARVWAGTDTENKASERVMQRLGMRFDHRVTVNGLPQIYYVLDRESRV